MGKRLIFLLGGARSGKSNYAENWAMRYGQNVLYVATAEALDEEMQIRIAKHRESRPDNWTTVEAPLRVGDAIHATESASASEADTVIIDCLTVLSANVLLQQPDDSTQEQIDAAIQNELEAMMRAYERSTASWLIVSNEVGMGVVPPSRLGRYYRDALGRANQFIARQANDVLLLIAGIPMRLQPSDSEGAGL
jgi:adenosylcobinamide kinase/adenosylcobinamide-phosphate guanylyltransferase